MKNTKIFESIRKKAIEFDALLKRQLAYSEKLETIAYKSWRADEVNKEKRRAFHEQSQKSDQLRKRIEHNQPFTAERWYMTEYLYSDAHAYEVIEVYSLRKMDVRRLDAKLTTNAKKKLQDSFIPGGFIGHTDNDLQEWTFESNVDNPIITVRLHKDGRYYRPSSRSVYFMIHDSPYEIHDFNF